MFTDPTATRQFVQAGNARLTIVSKKTGTRFTYRIRRPADDKPWFVQVLTGSDNENSYTFFGTIFTNGELRHSRKSSIGETAPSVVAFTWFWAHLLKGNLPEGIEVHHEGRCGRCGRALTVPESIESGFGPECINHV